ncbi:MAG: hypothetical protein KA322_00580 [Chitinophagales bacterium]|jgi:hypothetical protein|nr:hypothetical protein [Chitinophagales bacterium]
MIFLFFKWLYVTIISYLFGFFVSKKLNLFNVKSTEKEIHPSFIVILGFAILTTIASYFSLVIKLGALANLLLFIIGLLIFYFYKAELKKSFTDIKSDFLALDKKIIIVILTTIIACISISVHNSLNNDEGGYYAQIILWTETYPVVPGLVNLQDRLGFNSHWHLFAALTSFSWLTHQESGEINGLVWILATYYFLSTISAERNKLTDFIKLTFVLFIFTPIPYLFYVMICPSADMFIMLVIWMLFAFWIDKASSNKLFDWDSSAVITIIISFFLITTKASALPILIIPGVIMGYNFLKKEKKGVFFLSIFITFICSIWLVRNVILTGYLVFPFDKIDIFNPDWKGLLYDVIRQKDRIHDFGFNLYRANRIDVTGMPYFQKVYIWFTNNTEYYDRFLISCDILSILLIIINRKKFNASHLMIFAVLYVCIIFWFLQAPDPRFAYGPIGFMAMTALYFLFYTRNATISKHTVNFFLVIIFLFHLTAIFFFQTLENKITYSKKKEVTVIPQHSKFLMPEPFPTFKLDSLYINEQIYYYNKKNKGINWDAPLPAFHRTIHNSIKKRGKSLKDGFYLSNQDTTEIIIIPYEIV